MARQLLYVCIGVSLTVLLVTVPAAAEPYRYALSDGTVVPMLGVDALTGGACDGAITRALQPYRGVRTEADPTAPGMYVFDPFGRLLNVVAIETGCARMSAPTTARRFADLQRADRSAQANNRGQYAPRAASADDLSATNDAVAAAPVREGYADWTGTGTKDTETFQVPVGEWRIDWRATSTSRAGGVVSVMVYTADGQLVTTLSGDVRGAASDTSYVRAQPGRFYLKILSANCTWHVIAR